MACICGCDRDDHLHTLPSASASSTSAFKSGAPIFDDNSTNRFQLVREETGPSKSVPWRPKYAEDAELQEWAKSPNPFDGNRSPLGLPLPRWQELTSEDQMSKEAFMQDWHRNSDKPWGAQKPRRTSNVEQAFRVLWLPAKRVMRTSSFERRQIISSFSLPNTLAQPTADLSMKLATQSLPIQHGQSYRTSCSPPLLSRNACSDRWSPLELNQQRRRVSQDFPNPMLTEGENRASTKRQAEAVIMEDTPSSQTADSDTSIPEGCLCGCGGDAIRCLRPNRPPSPNTFFENFWAPEFAYILKTRLDAVEANLEPSKRIWWREEFGGCAPDRKPLFSETWNREWADRGSVLRTSPPQLYDSATVRKLTRFKASPTQQRAPSLPNRPIRNLDKLDGLPQDCQRPLNNASQSVPRYKSGRICERPNRDFSDYYTNDRRGRSLSQELTVARTAKPLKSPTHYVPDKLPPLKIPELSKENQLVTMREQLTLEERQQRQQSVLQNLEAIRLRRQRLLALPPEQRKLLFNPFSTPKSDDVKESQSSVEIIPDISKEIPSLRKREQLTTEENHELVRSALQKLEASKLRIQRRLALPPEQRKLAFANPFSTPKSDDVKESQSSVEIIPDFSNEPPLLHKEKQITPEERQQLRQSALQKLEASRLEMQRRLASPEQRKVLLAGNPFLTSKSDDVKESLSNVDVMKAVTTEKAKRLSCCLYQKIGEMKMRRNRRHGAALYRYDRLITSALPSTSQVHYLKKFSMNIMGPGEKSLQIDVKDPCVKKSNPRNTEGFQSRCSSVPIRGFGCQGIIFNHVGRPNQGHPIRHSM